MSLLYSAISIILTIDTGIAAILLYLLIYPVKLWSRSLLSIPALLHTWSYISFKSPDEEYAPPSYPDAIRYARKRQMRLKKQAGRYIYS